MKLSIDSIPDFTHKNPKGYHYERTDFKTHVSSIWIVNDNHFDYCGRSGIKSIWGFFNSKTQQFYAPINSKTMGKLVDFKNTSPYSSMQIRRTPLEAAFL